MARGDRSDTPTTKSRYKVLVENHIMSLIDQRIQKVKMSLEDLQEYFTPQNDSERAMLKLLANTTNGPEPTLMEIKQPASEQHLISKLNGSIVTSSQSEEFIKSLIESYQNDKHKLENHALRAMRKAFLQLIGRAIGRRKLAKHLNPSNWTYETTNIQFKEDKSSGQSSSTDSAPEEDNN